MNQSIVDDWMEAFALAPFDEKPALVEKLPKGSSEYLFFNILLEQLSSGSEVTPRETKLLEQLKDQTSGSLYQRMASRHEFRKYKEGSSKLPDSLVSFLKEKLNPNLSHRPDVSTDGGGDNSRSSNTRCVGV